MTHAEAASSRDGRWVNDNKGPLIWGGMGERWDLLQLSKIVPPMAGRSCDSGFRSCCESRMHGLSGAACLPGHHGN